MVCPTHRQTLRERGFHHSALRLYNALPQCLKEIDKVSPFKNQLEALLLENLLVRVPDRWVPLTSDNLE